MSLKWCIELSQTIKYKAMEKGNRADSNEQEPGSAYEQALKELQREQEERRERRITTPERNAEEWLAGEKERKSE
jgi:hypothetical protein